MANQAYITLCDLNKSIRGTLKSNFQQPLWIVAEISEVNVNASGHCYLELIQKDKDSDQIIARSRATIWGQTFRFLRPYFETTTRHPFSEGLSILIKITVEFHEVFGLSLNITDIEPTYTVGDIALQRQKIIERLEKEGVADMNRQVPLVRPCRKIAIISSESAAGYGDFIDQLTYNDHGYKFYYRLFPAIMQGDEAERTIIAALDRIDNYGDFFEAVVIIRGGGSQADLHCFNSYLLACHVAQFPLPVLTGIGHEQDDSVVDIVAHKRLKTPTAVAEFLISHNEQAEISLYEIAEMITTEARSFLDDKVDELARLSNSIHFSMKDNLNSARLKIIYSHQRLKDQVRKLNFYQTLRLNREVTNMQMALVRYFGNRRKAWIPE